MKTLLLVLLLSTMPVSAFAQESTAFELVIDESGVLLDPQEAQGFKLMLLAHVKALATKRATAHAKVNVIATSRGRTIWSGTPLELRREPLRAQALVDAIATDPRACNNLPGAFAELRSNLAQHARASVRQVQVVIFSSLVDTPRPCSDITRIALPQMPPAEADVHGALTGSPLVRSVAFYWVSPHQKRVWEEFLAPSFATLTASGVTLTFLDVERTKAALRSSPFTTGGALGETP